jgi:CubicO group peptidase (beta-lactamase class C family)
LADVEHHRVVDSSTVFRVASVGKVFTAIAALQFVDAGRIGLQQDLRPLFPDILGRRDITTPVTLHQLLTHTAGFDEQLIGYVNPSGAAVMPLAEFVATSLPMRSRPAGDIPGYSNQGYALAGLVVERVSMRPFDQYMEEEVFRPLGMLHTRYVLSPSDLAAAELALEYRSDGVREIPRSTRAYPAGNVGTTAGDMNGFLRWVLTGLRSPDSTSAASRITRRLVGPMLRYHPDLPPMGYGLSGVPMSGRTVWMKGGAAPRHSAVIAILPAVDVAIFIAVNRQEPLLWDWLLPDLVKAFWSDSAARAQPVAAEPPGPSLIVDGTYRWTRSSLGSVEKVLGLAAQLVVKRTPDGIAVSGPQLGGGWKRLGETSFVHESGRRMGFRAGADGRATHLFSILQGQPVSFERVSWHEAAIFQMMAVAIAVLLALAAAFASVHAGRAVRLRTASPHWASAIMIAFPLIQVGMLATALLMVRGLPTLLTGPTPAYRACLILAALTAVVGVAQAAAGVVLAARSNESKKRRTLFLLGAAAGLVITWFLAISNLATFGG